MNRQPYLIRAARCAVSCVAMIMTFASATAATFDYADIPTASVAFRPGHFHIDATGAWVAGNGTARFDASGALALFDPNVALTGDAMLVETLDGGVAEAAVPLVGTPFVAPCLVTKLGADDSIQWQFQLDASACNTIGADGAGSLWIATKPASGLGALSVYRIGLDGTEGVLAAVPPTFVGRALVASGGAGSYLAGYDATSGIASVFAFDAGGAVAWQWNDDVAGDRLTQIALDANGNVHAAGTTSDGSGLVVASVDPSGAERFRHTLEAPGADDASGYAVVADGSSFAYVPAGAGARAVVKIDANGALVWKSDVALGVGSVLSEVDERFAVRVAPNGDVVAIDDDGNSVSSSATTELFRFDANGTPVGSGTTLTGEAGASEVSVSDVATLPDASVLLTTRSAFSEGGLVTDGSAATTGTFLHFADDGHALALPFAAASVPATEVTAAAVVGDDGTTYFLTDQLTDAIADRSIGGVASRYALTAVSATGQRRWRSEGDGYWSAARVFADDARVCIVGARADYQLLTYTTAEPPQGGVADIRAECHDAGSGAPEWTTIAVPSGGGTAGNVANMLDDGTIVVAATTGTSSDGSTVPILTTAAIASDGNVVATAGTTSGAVPFAVGADGQVLTIIPGGAGTAEHAVTMSASGAIDSDTALPVGDATRLGERLDDGVSELVGIAADGSLELTAISPAGAILWRTTIAQDASSLASVSITSDANTTYVSMIPLVMESGPEGPPIGLTLGIVERASGVLTKTSAFADGPLFQAGVVIGADGTTLRYTLGQSVGVQPFDAAADTLGTLSHRGCGAAQCAGAEILAPTLTDDGALHYVVANPLATVNGARVAHVVAIDVVAADPVLVPAGQPGVDGVWYAPYESGQGFGISYISNSQTLFIPWFTYTSAGGNDPANLVWYSMQGPATAEGSSADLTIYANTGGTFNAGTTTSQPVGTATLSFTDCNNATLQYTFDNLFGDPASGTISMTRVTPAATACTSGGTAPAPVPDDGGFSTSQSGAWYDPSTSGQGLQITVVPAGNGSAGLLFGAWFTFDPAGAADDPTQQHWFTLQGDLSGATDGTVAVPIYSTLGGTFDGAPAMTTLRIGTATVKFTGCASASFDYAFDASTLAHAFAGKSGHIELSRLGGCSE